MIFRFIRQMVVVLGLSALGHWILGRWALRVFPGLHKHRTAFKRTLFVLACSPYVVRLLTQAVRSETLERIGAAALLEFMFAILAAMPIGAIEAWRALEARRARSKARAGVVTRAGDAVTAGASERALVGESDALRDPPKTDAPLVLSRRDVIERGAGLAFAGGTAAVLG